MFSEWALQIVAKCPEVTPLHARGLVLGIARRIDWLTIGENATVDILINTSTSELVNAFDQLPKEFVYGALIGSSTPIIMNNAG